jgi:hypothetical protein
VRTPTINRDLPWEAIRRDWQTSSISMVSLARKYGVASTTTLTRRVVSEGWKRDADLIEANPSAGQSAVALRTPLDRPANMREPPAPPDGSAPVDAAVANELDAELLLAQHDLAQAVATNARRHVALAVEVQRTGLLLLRRLQGVLRPLGDDAAAEALMLGNLQRLIRVNPDRETLVGLIAAAGKTIDLGLSMERRAIVANAASKLAPETTEAMAASMAASAKEAMKRLTPESAERLRQWAIDVQREQREAQIAAATKPVT